MPDLQQVLDLYWGNMSVNIEIKSVTHPQLLLDLLARYSTPASTGELPWIVISSFNHPVLLELKKLGCRWSLAPISCGIPLQFDIELQQIAPYSWHFRDEYLDLERVRYLREQGVATLVFTVNCPARAQYLRQNGVNGIFTDIPSQMPELMSQQPL